jgi:hypothetical protein
VKEHGILFSGPMVKAILAGEKTQTRRIVTWANSYANFPKDAGWDFDRAFADSLLDVPGNQYLKVPFGDPEDDTRDRVRCRWKTGDRLWCRETFTTYNEDSDAEREARFAKAQNIKSMEDLMDWSAMPAGGGGKKVLYAADFGDWAYDKDSDLGPWTPSIFMPRWASRITLEICEVRVQRLQDIHGDDARAEGCPNVFRYITEQEDRDAISWYRRLWESINGKGSWDANPWVWCLTFKRIEQPVDAPAASGQELRPQAPVITQKKQCCECDGSGETFDHSCGVGWTMCHGCKGTGFREEHADH